MLDLDAELEEYIGLHSEPEPEILQQLSRATHQKILRPRMLSGNLQGQFLKMLCRMNRVQRVLETGHLPVMQPSRGDGHGRERRAPYHRHQ